MGAERTFDGLAVHFLRAGPALRGTEYDHGPHRSLLQLAGSGLLLDSLDVRDAGVQRFRHGRVHLLRVVAFDEVRLPAAALEEALHLFVGDAGEDRRVGDLVAVQVQDGQHGAVARGIQELVRMPGRGQGAGLRFAVADDAGRDQIRVIEYRAERVSQGIAQFAAFVDGARRFGRHVAGDAAGERELLEQLLHAVGVLRDVRIHFRVGSVQPVLGDHGVAAVAGAGQVDHIQVVLFDDPVQMRIDEVLAGHCAPVADDLLLDLVAGEGLLQERVFQQIELSCGKIVRGAPPGVQLFISFSVHSVSPNCVWF